MPQTAPHGARRRRLFRHEGLGEEALHFTRWFAQSKYRLMGEFLGEIERAPETRSVPDLRSRYCRALEHGQRVHQARGIVTLLLAIGVVAAAVSTIANALDAPAALAADVAAWTAFLERLAAISASVSVLLIAIRLAMDRYLERIDVTATFLAMQLATTR